LRGEGCHGSREMELLMDDLYVNIGTVRCCLFVKMSRQLLRVLRRSPVLFFGVEEALLSAKNGWYGIGILVWSQILNALNRPAHHSRNLVAHELLKQRPTRVAFDEAVAVLKATASEQSERELTRHSDPASYRKIVLGEWRDLVSRLRVEVPAEKGY
jgi:hypothetical protein